MILLTGLTDQIDRLVHPEALACPLEAARHRLFMATRITTASCALAMAPLYLAAGGVPGWLDVLILAWMVVPLVAVAHVYKTGNRRTGEIATLTAWIGLAVTACLGHVSGIGAACAILFLVPMEAAFAGSARISTVSTVAVLAVLSALVAWTAARHAGLPSTGSADRVLVAFAAVHAAGLAFYGAAFERIRQNLERAAQDDDGISSETPGDLVLRFDRSGAALTVKGPAARRFGIEPHVLMGRGFFERVHVADRPGFLTAVSRCAGDSEAASVRLRLRQSSLQKPDSAFEEPVFGWVEMSVRPIESDSPAPVAPEITATVRDITLQVDHEIAMDEVRREAERAGAWKDRFLATVSHELRTPLNSIIGFGEMLTNDALAPSDPAKRREYAEIIQTSGQHLLAVVNSLLDLSKLDAGQFELLCEGFDVSGLIHSCCDMVSLKADQGRVTLRRDVEAGLEPLTADKRACKQIVLNLLSNAVKFTPAGGCVTVSARMDGPAVLIAVSDTGIGIKPRDMSRLGDPFFQVKDSYDRPYEGTGLGLSVVKGLVGLHGGTITAESAPGEGTSITVRLPSDCRRRPASAQRARIEVVGRFQRSLADADLETEKVQKIA